MEYGRGDRVEVRVRDGIRDAGWVRGTVVHGVDELGGVTVVLDGGRCLYWIGRGAVRLAAAPVGAGRCIDAPCCGCC